MNSSRPFTPHRNSGYDEKRGDHHGARDSHGGYVPDRDPGTKPEGYNQAHGKGKQAERTNAKNEPKKS